MQQLKLYIRLLGNANIDCLFTIYCPLEVNINIKVIKCKKHLVAKVRATFVATFSKALSGLD